MKRARKRKISNQTETIEETDPPADDKCSAPDAKKRKSANLYKPPTHAELQSLKETESLYRTNLIKLQIKELIKEIKPTQDTSDLETLLRKLKTHLTKVPPTDKVKLCDALSLVPSTVKYPLNFVPPPNLKGHFQFLPPAKVKVIGSHLLGTCLRKNANVDLSIKIPESCIQEKDHLNYRYIHKRAIYLCLIADYLLNKKRLIANVTFSYEQDNPLLPVITATLKGTTKYTVIIHTCISGDSFQLSKLSPSKNNVRWSAPPLPLSENREGAAPPPTPHYNALLLLEMETREEHLQEIYSAAVECPAITEAVLLCKIWLHQRQLDIGYGRFTGFHCSMIFLYLSLQQKLNKFMSSYQLFRILLQFIADSNWDTSGLSIIDRKKYPTVSPLEEFHSNYSVVFVDSSGYLNLTSAMSLQQYHVLRHEAKLSHAFLDGGEKGFQSVFLRPVDGVLRYDMLCKIELSAGEVRGSPAIDASSWDALVLDSGGWVWPLALERIAKVVAKGLDGRVQLIGHFPHRMGGWGVSKAPPTTDNSHVTMGIIFNTESIYKQLILGPPADSEEAKQFRNFWGQRSEMRRFSDGSINEAVLWEGEKVWQKRTIPEQILKHVLLRHAGITSLAVTNCIIDLVMKINESTGEEESVGVVSTFTELSRQLRQLKGLPLDIATVMGASPVLCHAEVSPPTPWNGKLGTKYQSFPVEDVQKRCLYPSCHVATPPYIPALNVILKMESSGKWPKDLSALNDIKTAFYLDIAKCMWKQYKLITVPSKCHLDVLKDGYVFRLSIYDSHEMHLLKDSKKTSLIEKVEQTRVFRPLLTSTLTGLHNQFSSFSLGVRLCKRWVCSHLLTNQISEEVIELLVAHLFLHPDPFTAPGSATCTFLRFLQLIVSHDWSHDPLIVNFNNQYTDEKLTEITTQFNNKRHAYPLMFIATPIDPASQCTKTQPTPVVLNRLIELARGSLKLLTNQIDSLCAKQENPPDFMQIFRTPLSDYDLLICLEKKFIPQRQSKNSSISTEPTHLPVVEFDPLHSYVQALEAAFSNYALFFYNKYGGDVIGVVWKPEAFRPRPLKVYETGCCITKSRDGKKLTLLANKDAIINDFFILGEGLVNKVIAPPTN